MTLPILLFYLVLTSCWIFSMVASLLVVRWSFTLSGRRFYRSLGFALGAIIIALLGTTTFYVTSTATNNEKVTHYDTRWLFLVALVLDVAALACAIWKKAKTADTA